MERETIEHFAAFLRKEEAGRLLKARGRRKKALVLAKTLGKVLADEFGASSAWVFGSTAHGHRYGLKSDIDVAASGIKPEAELAAFNRLENLAAPEFRVDLLNLDDCPDILKQSVFRDGVRLV